MLRSVKLYGTTDGSGDFTTTEATISTGLIHSVEWIDGDLIDGVDAVISQVRDNDAADVTILTLTNANIDKVYYPRTPAMDAAGVDVTYDGTNEIYVRQFLNGKLKIVISAGGDTKTGGCIVYYEA